MVITIFFCLFFVLFWFYFVVVVCLFVCLFVFHFGTIFLYPWLLSMLRYLQRWVSHIGSFCQFLNTWSVISNIYGNEQIILSFKAIFYEPIDHEPHLSGVIMSAIASHITSHLDYLLSRLFRGRSKTVSATKWPSNGNIFRVTGESPAQRPVTWSLDVFFARRLNKRLGKQSWGWWFETPSRSLWRHCE